MNTDLVSQSQATANPRDTCTEACLKIAAAGTGCRHRVLSMACSAFSLVQGLHSSRKSCLCLLCSTAGQFPGYRTLSGVEIRGGYLQIRAKPSRLWSQPPVSSVSFSQQTQDAFVEELLTFILVPRGKTCSQPFFSANVIEIRGASWRRMVSEAVAAWENWYPHCHYTSTF